MVVDSVDADSADADSVDVDAEEPEPAEPDSEVFTEAGLVEVTFVAVILEGACDVPPPRDTTVGLTG